MEEQQAEHVKQLKDRDILQIQLQKVGDPVLMPSTQGCTGSYLSIARVLMRRARALRGIARTCLSCGTCNILPHPARDASRWIVHED